MDICERKKEYGMVGTRVRIAWSIEMETEMETEMGMGMGVRMRDRSIPQGRGR